MSFFFLNMHQNLYTLGNLQASCQGQVSAYRKGLHTTLQGIGSRLFTHKHLGRVLNECLTWSDHISRVYTACARMIGILRRLNGTIRSPAMKRIYTAVIRPRMEYACAVWSGGPTVCLQRLQDSFAKRHSLSLPPLEKRFEYHTLVLFL